MIMVAGKRTGTDPRRTSAAGGGLGPAALDPVTLLLAVDSLIDRALECETQNAAALARVGPDMQPSARNFLHYLALRQTDERQLQEGLRRQGLSSLGRAESCVLRTLIAVRDQLARRTGAPQRDAQKHLDAAAIGFDAGGQLLESRREALFGPGSEGRKTRIMVTMPGRAARDPEVIHELVAAGMDIMRINCAHDAPEDWHAMLRHLRIAESVLGRRVIAAADLAGCKLRTVSAPGRKKHALRLKRGDRLRLLRRSDDISKKRKEIGCTMPAALETVEVGHSVWFNDGRIGGVVRSQDGEGLDIEIVAVRKSGAPLRGGKGINLPDSPSTLPALTEVDQRALDVLATQVDLVGLSFVRSADDIHALHRALDRLDAGRAALVIKIETRDAFENLPRIMLAAMERGPFAIMIARGDLAVEIGFERLAEVQEEILWLAEAAHAPVIWATQVLEGMAKKGAPSRAEVTDAAMAERAECVLLNKGRYVCEAVGFLDDVLRRMEQHQYKKRSMLRRLEVSDPP